MWVLLLQELRPLGTLVVFGLDVFDIIVDGLSFCHRVALLDGWVPFLDAPNNIHTFWHFWCLLGAWSLLAREVAIWVLVINYLGHIQTLLALEAAPCQHIDLVLVALNVYLWRFIFGCLGSNNCNIVTIVIRIWISSVFEWCWHTFFFLLDIWIAQAMGVLLQTLCINAGVQGSLDLHVGTHVETIMTFKNARGVAVDAW